MLPKLYISFSRKAAKSKNSQNKNQNLSRRDAAPQWRVRRTRVKIAKTQQPKTYPKLIPYFM
jgi:hypothetical protein